MKNLMRAPEREASTVAAPYRSPAVLAAQGEDEFMAEVRAGAQHAVLLRQKAYLNRLMGGAPPRWLRVTRGLPGTLLSIHVLVVMGLILFHRWLYAFDTLLVGIVLSTLANAALVLAVRRVDAALARVRAQLGAEEIASFQRALLAGEHSGIAPAPPEPSPGTSASGGGIADAVATAVEVELVVHAAHDLGIDLPDPFDFDD